MLFGKKKYPYFANKIIIRNIREDNLPQPETQNSTRMDIVVTYGNEEHIIELKNSKSESGE